jgi:hypothetical protein
MTVPFPPKDEAAFQTWLASVKETLPIVNPVTNARAAWAAAMQHARNPK